MQFSDLIKAIHDAWTFAWPPLALCGILYLVSRFLNPEWTKVTLQKVFTITKTNAAKLKSLRSVLEPYGLTKLVPIISSVLVIGILYLLNSPITFAVSKLPPHIIYYPDQLIGRTTSMEEKLVLIRKYPTAGSFNAVYSLALEDAKAKGNEQRDNRAAIYYKIHNFLKFALAVAVVLVVVNVKMGVGFFPQVCKLILLFLLVVILWFVTLIGLLREQEQQFHDEWISIRLALQDEAKYLLEAEETQYEQSIISIHDQGERWWRIYVVDPYIFSWFFQTFVPIKVP